MTPEERDRLVAAYFAGDISEADRATLLSEVRADPKFARDVSALLVTERLMKAELAGSSDDAFAREVLERLNAGAAEPEFAQEVVTRVKQRQGRRKSAARAGRRPSWLPMLAAAGVAVVVAASLVFVWSRQQPSVAKNDAPAPEVVATLTSGKAQIGRGQQTLAAGPDAKIAAGDRVSVGSQERAAFRYADGSSVDVNANTDLNVATENGAKRITLDRGAIYVVAASQPAGKPWVIQTADANATIMGTAFEVAVADGTTTLRVAQGEVRFGKGAQEIPVSAGKSSFAKAGNGPSAPASIAVGEVAAWRPGAVQPASGPKVEALIAGDFPDASHWETRNQNVTPEFNGAKLTLRPTVLADPGVLDLVAKEAFDLADGQSLTVRLKISAQTKSVNTGILLLDADDATHGGKPHIHVGFTTNFSDTMLAIRTFPDAPINNDETGMANRLHHGRWTQPAPAGKDSLVELTLTSTLISLRVDGSDQGAYKHGLKLRRWRLALRGAFNKDPNKHSQLEWQELTVKRETK